MFQNRVANSSVSPSSVSVHRGTVLSEEEERRGRRRRSRRQSHRLKLEAGAEAKLERGVGVGRV